MADKPSRALVIYGDGHAPIVSPASEHLHAFAARASCGFLSIRSPPPDTEETESDRVTRELSQLLDSYDFYMEGQNDKSKMNKNPKDSAGETISQRYMGLRAAIITTSSAVKNFSAKLGLTVFEFTELLEGTDSSGSSMGLSDYSVMITKLLKLLGFSGEDVLEKSEFDLVLLHVTPNGRFGDSKEKMVIKTDVNWLNSLVGGIMQASQPGSIIASRLHFSVILGYGTISEGDDNFSLAATETNSDLSLLRPYQSYTMKGGNILDSVRNHHPLLVAQWQDGVTRRDLAKIYSFEEFKKQGSNLPILVDRFFPEVAFKLWKAPKYGA